MKIAKEVVLIRKIVLKLAHNHQNGKLIMETLIKNIFITTEGINLNNSEILLINPIPHPATLSLKKARGSGGKNKLSTKNNLQQS